MINTKIKQNTEKRLWRNARRKRKTLESQLSKDMHPYRQIATLRWWLYGSFVF